MTMKLFVDQYGERNNNGVMRGIYIKTFGKDDPTMIRPSQITFPHVLDCIIGIIGKVFKFPTV